MSNISSGVQLSGALAHLSRINIRYLIEWHRQGELYRSISLPLPPTALSIQATAPNQITYTLGDHPIRELGHYRQHLIELDGSAGYDARPGYTASGAIQSALGPEILKEFRHFLELYQEAAADEGAHVIIGGKPRPQHELIFRALDEGYDLKIEVQSLTVSREADDANLAPRWALTLQGYDHADHRAEDFNLISAVLSPVAAALQTVADIGVTAQLVTEGTNGYIRQGLKGPLEGLLKLTSAVSGTLAGVREIVDIPVDLVRAVSRASGELRSSTAALIDDIVTYDDEMSAEFNLLSQILGLAEESEANADSILAEFPRLETREVALSPIVPRTVEPEIAQQNSPTGTAYRLRQGEDLSTLAARLFGDLDLWVDLAELNGWLSASQDSRGQPARAGQLIILPSNIPSPQVSEIAYGQDLYIDPKSGDLDLVQDDFRLISGGPNLEQALRHRLSTRQGETPILSRYGLPERIGQPVSASSAGLLSSHIREQMLKDVRVDSIALIEVRDLGDQLSAQVEFRASAGALQTSEFRGL